MNAEINSENYKGREGRKNEIVFNYFSFVGDILCEKK
jgi:hypothetical protein